MAIYYTQLLNRDSKRILCGTYSTNGIPLKSNKELLYDLKDAIKATTYVNEKIYSASNKDGKYMFYLQYKGELLLCCITDKRISSQDISKFFQEINSAYNNTFADNTTPHYEFDDKIKQISDDFNKNKKVSRGVEELESAHNILVENLDTLINRGENINNLKDLADKVSFETKEMSRKVGQIKRNAQMEKYKIYAVIAIVIFIIFYFFFL